MKWELDYGWKVKVMDDIEDVTEAILDQMESTYFDHMLDECHQEVNIFGYDFTPSDILKSCDPVAYRCGFEDYKDSLRDDIEYELERLTPGEEPYLYGVIVTLVEEED